MMHFSEERRVLGRGAGGGGVSVVSDFMLVHCSCSKPWAESWRCVLFTVFTVSVQRFPFVWETEPLLICKVMTLERERARERELTGGELQKMLNILIPFLAVHMHLYLAVWASQEEPS